MNIESFLKLIPKDPSSYFLLYYYISSTISMMENPSKCIVYKQYFRHNAIYHVYIYAKDIIP